MFAGSHFLGGAGIDRLAEGKPAWIKWPAVIGGGFLSHYVLDSVACYHAMTAQTWENAVLADVQIAAVASYLVSCALTREWKGIASGFWAWMSWDWERVFDVNWLLPRLMLRQLRGYPLLHLADQLSGVDEDAELDNIPSIPAQNT
jgi:hypothetical protein